jgi:hypothetical protein
MLERHAATPRSLSAQTPRPPRSREKMKRASAMITSTMRMVHNMGAPGVGVPGPYPWRQRLSPTCPRDSQVRGYASTWLRPCGLRPAVGATRRSPAGNAPGRSPIPRGDRPGGRHSAGVLAGHSENIGPAGGDEYTQVGGSSAPRASAMSARCTRWAGAAARRRGSPCRCTGHPGAAR